MSRQTADVPDPTASEPVRICAECRRAKTIRGVWYLVPGRAPSPFVCEACFGARPPMPALS